MKYEPGITLLIAIILPLIALMAFLMQSVDIQAAVNTTEISVNISEVAQISVSPKNLAWSQVAPGANGSVENITVKNIGSTTFSTSLYVSVDSFANLTNNPTAQDDVSKHFAGNFIVATNSTYFSNDVWWFMNQISWNESTKPTGMSGDDSNAASWGYFQNKSEDWLWELKNGSEGQCINQTGASFKVVQTADSKDLGSSDSGDFITNNSEWATWNFESGVFSGHCVATHVDCKQIMVYKFDKNSSIAGTTCGNATDILGASLTPNQEKTFYLKPHVPQGVPSGTVSNSTVTVTAT